MAEGGYDPETTNPFDPHGDDHDDGENIPLITIPKEKPPKYKYPKSSTPIQHSSTSAHDNPSFVDTASVILHDKEFSQNIGAIKVKSYFPHTDTSKYFTKMDEDGATYIKIKGGTRNIWHQIINRNEEVIMRSGIKKLPKKLRDALGKTFDELIIDKYPEDRERIEEGIITDRIEEDKRAEERIRKLREQMKNAFPEDRERINAAIEREKEGIDEREQEIAAIEERTQENEAVEEKLSLRERIKTIFKKYGFTVFSIASAIGVVIGVVVSNLKAGLTKVAKGVGNGLKELGAKLGQILPGMIGAIASFIFKTAGEAIGFLAKNAWLLIVGLVVLAVEQFKKKG